MITTTRSAAARDARRKNFWSSSNKSFRPRVFSSAAVNKRSRRLWRAALTTGTGGTLLIRRIDGKTSSKGGGEKRYISTAGGGEDVYVLGRPPRIRRYTRD